MQTQPWWSLRLNLGNLRVKININATSLFVVFAIKLVLGCLEIKNRMENSTLTERTSDIRVRSLQLVRGEENVESSSPVEMCNFVCGGPE